MIKKNPSKSLTQRNYLPHILPPLQKKNTFGQERVFKDDCTACRPTNFIIRKKISSYTESSTTRPPIEAISNKQNLAKQQNNFAKSENYRMLSKLNFKKQKHREQFKDSIFNKQASVCQIDLGVEYIFNKFNGFEQKKIGSLNQSGKVAQNSSTFKSITKRNSKRRKVEQCKTRKINWGAKNQALEDLTISAIKQKQDQRINTPIDSLQELYIQIL